MSQNRRTIPLRTVSRVLTIAIVCCLCHMAVSTVNAQVVTTDHPPSPGAVAPHDEELTALTPAQQRARQLATVLSSEQPPSTTSAQTLPLSIITEQTMRLGNRLIIPLFTSAHLEGRFLGGIQTFTSPVAHDSSSSEDDARRPIFLPSLEETFMALEILAK